MLETEIRKEFGPHKYEPRNEEASCLNGCGVARSGNKKLGGPAGIEIDGKCPANPMGHRLDTERVATDTVPTELTENINYLVKDRVENLISSVREDMKAVWDKLKRVQTSSRDFHHSVAVVKRT